MNIAIYARKSVDKGPNSISIEMQLEECKRRAALEDPKAKVDEFQDTGFSGKNTNRPEFLKMIELVKIKRYDMLIVYKLDRISRSVVDFYNIFGELEKAGCKFVSVVDNFDTSTAMGRLIMGILANFAEMERETIKQRVSDSFYALLKGDGRFLGGHAPIGYKRCRDQYNHPSLEIDPDMAEVIKQLFNKYATDTNCSVYELTGFLREKYGINKYGGGIRNILANEKYVKADEKIYKYFKYNGCEILKEKEYWNGTHACQAINTKTKHDNGSVTTNDISQWKVGVSNWEGIIDSDTWLIVQQRLKMNKENTSGTIVPKMKWKELTSLIKCGECGSNVRIVGNKGNLYRNISCSRKWHGKGANTCTMRFTKLKPETVWENVADKIQRYLDNLPVREASKEKVENSIKHEIKVVSFQIDNLVNTIASNPNPALIRQLDKLQKKLDELNLELVNNLNNEEDLIRARIHSLTGGNKIDYRKLSEEEKHSLLKILLERIRLFRDGSVIFEWRGVTSDSEDIVAALEELKKNTPEATEENLPPEAFIPD